MFRDLRKIKYLKILLSSSSLIGCFLLGVGVGMYKWFPYHQIRILKDIIIDSSSSENNNEELLIELSKNNNIDINKIQKRENELSVLKENNSIRFISFGDNQPYVEEKETRKVMRGLLNSINSTNSDLIVHVGDTQNGFLECTDSMTDLQRDLMNSLNAPVLYTPGDNDWRDCLDNKKGEDFNLKRLAYIRETFFSDNRTLGRNANFVENQSSFGYPENSRLMKKGVAFITAHVVGQHNNFDPLSKENTLEYFDRDAANIDWIKKSFERFSTANAYVLVIHADIFGGSYRLPEVEYRKFANTLFDLSNKYKKPVLLLHGDRHEFRAYQPMRENYPFLHAIQNFGYPDLKALEIEVSPSKKIPFNVISILE